MRPPLRFPETFTMDGPGSRLRWLDDDGKPLAKPEPISDETAEKFYSEDQLRDERGRWTDMGGSGSDGGAKAHRDGSPDRSGRAWKGHPTIVHHRLGKQATGRVAEHIVLQHAKEIGLRNPHALNTGSPNYPVDIRAGNMVIEVKGGQVSNGRQSQQWRVTLGSFGPAEKRAYERMNAAQKERYNAAKMRAALARKEEVRRSIEKNEGRKITGWTYGVIVNPDKGTADIYRFKGFHDRIGWRGADTEKGYVTTVKYTPPKGKR